MPVRDEQHLKNLKKNKLDELEENRRKNKEYETGMKSTAFFSKGVPAFTSLSNFAPTIFLNIFGGNPKPGRMRRISFGPMICPAGKSFIKYIDLLKILLPSSAFSRPKPALPKAAQASFTSSQSRFSSCGSSENSQSGPLSALFKVKCFSITVAPNATADAATV